MAVKLSWLNVALGFIIVFVNVSKKQFETWVKQAINNLPEKYLKHMNNVAIIIEDYPSEVQKNKLNLRRGSVLFGLYEGYYQAMRLNVGPVLPDRIIIFRKAIADYCSSKEEIKRQIKETVKHEIAHHFGSGEDGARKAGRR